jgi:tetratricopeptide (TPR) repeat protein
VARRAAEAWVNDGDLERAEQWLIKELNAAGSFEEGAALAWRTATGGALLNWWRRNERGLRLLEEALSSFETLQELGQAIHVRLDVASALTDLGRHEEALAHLQRCLDLAAERSDRVVRQHALANRGEVLRRKREHPEAKATLVQAVGLARELADGDSVAHTLGNLGLVEEQMGDIAAASSTYSEQLQLARQVGSRQAKASALSGLANIDFLAGRFSRAAAGYRRAADLCRPESPVGEVENLGGLLESLASAERDVELQKAAQRLVDAAQRASLEDNAALAFARTAHVLLGRGERVGAADLYSASLQVVLAPTAGATNFIERATQAVRREAWPDGRSRRG